MKYSLRKLFSNKSGHHGHQGRPGKRGGSLPGSGGGMRSEPRLPSDRNYSPEDTSIEDAMRGFDEEEMETADMAILGEPTKYGEHQVTYKGRQIGEIIPIATYPGMDPKKKYGAYFYTERGNRSQLKTLYSSPQEAADALKIYAKKHPKRKTRMERFKRHI